MGPPQAAPTPHLAATLGRALPAQLLETHISWVLLTAQLAYKIKKPVRLPFVDYGTLAARRHFCEEEVRLNGRLAPTLYLGVSRITGSEQAPRIDGPGQALDYAVRMRRFAPGALFSERVAAGTLLEAEVDALAALLAGFHEHAPAAAPDSGFASAQRRLSAALAALAGCAAVASQAEQEQVHGWLERQGALLAPLWNARLAAQRVREGHGDLHLDNVVCLDSGVAAFDCIEFDPALRWIDVIDDLAFAVMDFGARGRSDFGFRLLNAWLDHTGDHGAVPALPFSAVYRALVRAHVEHLRGAQRVGWARAYLDAALHWLRPRAPSLYITHGLPGAGKSFQSQRLLEAVGAIRLRSDVERKRLFGLGPLADTRAAGIDLYTAGATARTYGQLFATARMLLQAGFPVVIDAAFLRRDERAAALALARELAVRFCILDCQAAPEVLRQRLLARRGDASEAGVEVLERLRLVAEPLTGEELSMVVPAAS